MVSFIVNHMLCINRWFEKVYIILSIIIDISKERRIIMVTVNDINKLEIFDVFGKRNMQQLN